MMMMMMMMTVTTTTTMTVIRLVKMIIGNSIIEIFSRFNFRFSILDH